MSTKVYYLCDQCHKAIDAPCSVWLFDKQLCYEGRTVTRETKVAQDLCHECLLNLLDFGERRASGGQPLVLPPSAPREERV